MTPAKRCTKCRKKESARDLVSEIMSYEPKDIAVEDEEIGVIVERIYQERGE